MYKLSLTGYLTYQYFSHTRSQNDAPEFSASVRYSVPRGDPDLVRLRFADTNQNRILMTLE